MQNIVSLILSVAFNGPVSLSCKCNSFAVHYCGPTVAQLVDAPSCKPEGFRFNSGWCHWNFSLA
jgi:hypothetical protein